MDLKIITNHKKFVDTFLFDSTVHNKPHLAYAKVYDKPFNSPVEVKRCVSASSRLMGHPDVLLYMRFMTEKTVFSEEFIDHELGWMATQREELAPKIQAIKEFNRLKGRITEKIEVNKNTAPISGFTFVVQDAEVIDAPNE